jgi:hypothetical protein
MYTGRAKHWAAMYVCQIASKRGKFLTEKALSLGVKRCVNLPH